MRHRSGMFAVVTQCLDLSRKHFIDVPLHSVRASMGATPPPMDVAMFLRPKPGRVNRQSDEFAAKPSDHRSLALFAIKPHANAKRGAKPCVFVSSPVII